MKKMEFDNEYIINLTKTLNQSIIDGNFEKYKELSSQDMTCFEPEAVGYLVVGRDFHEFYYLNGDKSTRKIQFTIQNPSVRFIGDGKVAIIAYVKIMQIFDIKTQTFKSTSNEETRVWNYEESSGKWLLVHVHRSPNKP